MWHHRYFEIRSKVSVLYLAIGIREEYEQVRVDLISDW